MLDNGGYSVSYSYQILYLDLQSSLIRLRDDDAGIDSMHC